MYWDYPLPHSPLSASKLGYGNFSTSWVPLRGPRTRGLNCSIYRKLARLAAEQPSTRPQDSRLWGLSLRDPYHNPTKSVRKPYILRIWRGFYLEEPAVQGNRKSTPRSLKGTQPHKRLLGIQFLYRAAVCYAETKLCKMPPPLSRGYPRVT